MAGNKTWKRWKPEEDQILRDHFPYIESHEISEVLEGRSWTALRTRAWRLGVRKSHEAWREICRANHYGRKKATDQPSSSPPDMPSHRT